MTDKQIIIDGVDVSGCEYYCERYCKQVVAEDGCYVFLCAEDKICHYKKWQRKEQECEELKGYLNQIRDEELSHLDIEWNEYETSARKYDYSNIITLVERALGEIDD